tara:strand:+ start:548 stop:1189 length:642 start_codon:yes stop_codon:yes gene_type:complete
MIQSLIPPLDEVLRLFFSLSLGIFISLSLIISGQRWARSFNNVLTFVLLPMISFSITSMISSNIALSLGMVGALSIVRFRHPVKSPLELVIYFLLVALGIGANTKVSITLLLALVSMIIIYLYSLYESKNNGISRFIPYLETEYETRKFFIEVVSSRNINELENNNNLILSNINLEEEIFIYKLAFDRLTNLNSLKDNIYKFDSIKSIKTFQS